MMKLMAGDTRRLGSRSGRFGAMASSAIFDPRDHHRAAGFGVRGIMTGGAFHRPVLAMVEMGMGQKTGPQRNRQHDTARRLLRCACLCGLRIRKVERTFRPGAEMAIGAAAPVIEDYVTIGYNSNIIGGVQIGRSPISDCMWLFRYWL